MFATLFMFPFLICKFCATAKRYGNIFLLSNAIPGERKKIETGLGQDPLNNASVSAVLELLLCFFFILFLFFS